MRPVSYLVFLLVKIVFISVNSAVLEMILYHSITSFENSLPLTKDDNLCWCYSYYYYCSGHVAQLEMSDCRSRGREFDPSPVLYFRRD